MRTFLLPAYIAGTLVLSCSSALAQDANASAARTTTVTPPPSPKGLSDQPSAIRPRETVLSDNVASPRAGNAPVDPSYEGFIPIFATTAWVKLGGYGKLDAIVDSNRIGNPNKFVTSTIPVAGEPAYAGSQQFALHAKQSRLNLDVRAPTPIGSVRVFYENDFFGNATSATMDYNLRHFYAQVANLTLGQTWSTFFDPDSIPDTLDMSGPGVMAAMRQAQIRYTATLVEQHLHMSVSAERPSSDIGNLPSTGGARNMMPDFIAQLRFEGRPGHLQLGGLARALAWEDSTGPEDVAFGWGANLSGVVHTWRKDDLVGNVTYGDGIGRYMQDLPGGSAAIVTADGELAPLRAWGGFASYRHSWNDSWRSSATYGYAKLHSRAQQAAKTYDHTHYAQGNLTWSPIPKFLLGIEYLYGRKGSRDGSDGHDHRGQLSAQYKLF